MKLKIKDKLGMESVVHKTQLAHREPIAAADLRNGLSHPMEARLASLELLREQMYPSYAEQGIRRDCRIVPLKAA